MVAILNFSYSWLELVSYTNILTTPKVHIILDHLCDYFDETGITLKKVTDELVESCHQYVHKRMTRGGYIVKDETSDSHGDKLFRAIMHVNTYNLRIINK